MIFELGITTGLTVMLLALLAEYVDSSIGMGYGTTLTPILLLYGFEPLQIIPAVLLSQLVAGIFAGFLHHKFGNVDFRSGKHLKIAIILALCGIIGTIASVLIAINISALYLKLYIGFLVITVGIVILITINKKYAFSWEKIAGFGLFAAFNKGLSGGGYGPVVVMGQLLSGSNEKNAIAITALAEGLTCIVAVIAYSVTGRAIWVLAPYLLIGSILSVPLSTFTVKIIKGKQLRMIIGIATIILGIFTIITVLH
ncbi:MAG: sulfite exporter TauE/SafE family protein [Candidatus Altiarchaeales archaeon]|nr:sulfite exporter TauE/SafE family protein [Candidatus Altiarchaeota archaeon]MBU4341677.1 sulfite exporter TauE/SafE family protein [Candidatus Altiarchaeota archaeon]MBU4437751.1 sulfite exporter TauE/SafE family protein [Candidatus Altiarchaeota archaeon]MCG2782223.1 sulfite exporter TauE/SafE family protein [Candidatus Altiarchaeales archaeon]